MIDESIEYAKEHKKNFLKQIVSGKQIMTDKVAIFMAGSPGAGKTEVATSIEELSPNLCLIDADAFRIMFPKYDGSNSNEFQKGASWLVDHTFTAVLRKGYSFILDGTFAISKSKLNIERVIKRGYEVSLYYVYQDPYVAWEFTKKRQETEGRYVPKAIFINAYFKSRENTIHVKDIFGDQIKVTVIFKDYENNISDILEDVDNLELVLPGLHTSEELEAKLDD